MSTAPAPTRRRAWRFLIAMTLLVGAVWWWQTPHVDPRFVGSWKVTLPAPQQPRTWILDARGRCHFGDERRRGDLVAPWHGDGDSWVIGQGPSWAYNLMDGANALLYRVMGWMPFSPPEEFKVVSVNEQSFVLRHVRGGSQLVFTRIPDIAVLPTPMSDQSRVLLAAEIAIVSIIFFAWNARRRRKRQKSATSEPLMESAP